MGSLSSRIVEQGKALRGTRVGRAVELHRRVDALEAEIQECRALNLRVAELTDLVTELLVPVAQRDEKLLGEMLAKYSSRL
jgi:hypothetical protein